MEPDRADPLSSCSPRHTERLVLRRPRAQDRSSFIALHSSAVVRRYLGGALGRDELDAQVPPVPADRPGSFVVEEEGAFVGHVSLSERDPERPGLPSSPNADECEGGELELSYLFLPNAWGRGLAREACSAVLGLVDVGRRVVVCTQVANTASVRLAERLGFVEAARFEEFGAVQWFGVRPASESRG